MLLFAPHLLPVHARQAMAQPPKAAAVTTAEARAFERVKDSDLMGILLKVAKKKGANYLAAAQPVAAPHLTLLAPHLALHAPHLAFLAPHLALHAPHLALLAPHLVMLVFGPHFAAVQPAANAPPERAAAVTTAEPMVLAI